MSAFTLLRTACGVAATFLSAHGLAMCYQVYDAQDLLIYRSQQAPVSMSSPALGDAVQQRFPGAQMAITTETPCPHLDLTTAAGRAQASAQKHLLAAKLISTYAAPAALMEPESSVTPTSTLAPAKAPAVTERIIETRIETVYVPAPVAPIYHHRQHGKHDGPHTPTSPTAPASLACGDRGFFSFCTDGSRANASGHFAYGTDGKLKK